MLRWSPLCHLCLREMWLAYVLGVSSWRVMSFKKPVRKYEPSMKSWDSTVLGSIAFGMIFANASTLMMPLPENELSPKTSKNTSLECA
ncbi:hypothetical protein [Treponema sp. R6D11]